MPRKKLIHRRKNKVATHRKRAAAALGFGALSALSGLLMSTPSVWTSYLLSRPGVALSEMPWLPIGTGLAAVALGRRGAKIGGWLGLCGVMLGVRPLWHVPAVLGRHKSAMHAGLGHQYELTIPADVLENATRARLSFGHTYRQRQTVKRTVCIYQDVPFFSDGMCTLYADIYEPMDSKTLRPAIIAVHGGSWRGGDKGGYHAAKHRRLAQQGYVVFDVQYRLSPEHIWPTHLIDVKTAIRWVRANAERYRVDPEQIALIGRSAGGHLALMAAFTAGDPSFPPLNDLPERDDVQAVVAIYPPTDLVLLQETVVSTLGYWLGKPIEHDPELYRQASPVHAAHVGAPPVLLAHGGRDNLVVAEHSERLAARLRTLSVPIVSLHYPWGRHGLDFSLNGLGGHMLQYDTERFLAWALRRANDEREGSSTH